MGGQSLQADRQAAMRRHSQVKHPKMTFKAVRVHAAIAEGILQVFPVMQALAAGRDFNAMEQQIEALCRSVRSPGCCIELADRRAEIQ